jgi:hypothetical protein
MPSRISSRKKVISRSDRDEVPGNGSLQIFAPVDPAFQDEGDPETKKMFQVIPQVHDIPPDRMCKIDQDIHITPFDLFISGIGSKDTDLPDAILSLEIGLCLLKNFKDLPHLPGLRDSFDRSGHAFHSVAGILTMQVMKDHAPQPFRGSVLVSPTKRRGFSGFVETHMEGTLKPAP